MIHVLVMALLMSAVGWSAEVKVLSWNVYMLPKPIKNSKQKERSLLIAQELKKLDHDVIVLQEAFSQHFRSVVGSALSQSHPYQLRLSKSGAFKQVMCSGIFILSRWPMKFLDSNYFNTCAGADCFSSKGVLLAELERDQKKIQLAVTHMQASDEFTHQQIRQAQTITVSNLLYPYIQNGVPQVLAGDLNIDSMVGQEFAYVLKALNMTAQGQDLMESTKAQNTNCFTKRDSTRLVRKDHVLSNAQSSESFSISTTVQRFRGQMNGKNCDLSDHYALSSKITF
jgi:endonuclease/exonuclease/phosphatase family metal-dependent hydrolase